MNTNEITWTSEDVKLVEKFIEIKNKGYYCDGTQLTTVYNRVLHKSAPPTNCGSCMRARISELERGLRAFEKQLEINSTSEEKEAKEEPIPEEIKENKKVGRPPKKKE